MMAFFCLNGEYLEFINIIIFYGIIPVKRVIKYNEEIKFTAKYDKLNKGIKWKTKRRLF